jgi:glutathione S-transferase
MRLLAMRGGKDAALRAAVRLFVSQLNFAPMYSFLMDQDRAQDGEHITACRDALVALESRYASASPTGPFFLGEALSAADIALLPFIDRLCPGLAAYRGYHMLNDDGAPPLPRICTALRAVQARDSWRATAQSPAFYVSAYEGYAAGRRSLPHRVRAQSPDASAFAAVKPEGPLPAACRKEA